MRESVTSSQSSWAFIGLGTFWKTEDSLTTGSNVVQDLGLTEHKIQASWFFQRNFKFTPALRGLLGPIFQENQVRFLGQGELFGMHQCNGSESLSRFFPCHSFSAITE